MSPKRLSLMYSGSGNRSLMVLSIAAFIYLFTRRQRNELGQWEKMRAVLHEVGNPGFSPAAAAVMQLFREGYLTGQTSILRGRNLMGANWQRVVLPEADLQRVDLRYADLRDAILEHANLKKADFHRANLVGAKLRGAKLEESSFFEADLRGANLNAAHARHTSFLMAHLQRTTMYGIHLNPSDLQEADFHGATMVRALLSNSLLRDTNFAKANLEKAHFDGAQMTNANLAEANLSSAYFDTRTVLPDAQFVRFDENGYPIFDKYWTPDTDMTQYTDPKHPYFWQPKWAKTQEWVKRNYAED